MSGGLMVMAITAMAIMSNAMFLQAGRHPEPLFATRPAPLPSAADCRTVRAPAAHAPNSSRRCRRPTAPQPPAAAAATAPQPAPVDARPGTLITAVQRELARLGLYTGAIDGLSGPRTKAAISTWQTAAGIKVTGEPTPGAARCPAEAGRSGSRPAAPVPAVVSEAASTDQVAAAVAPRRRNSSASRPPSRKRRRTAPACRRRSTRSATAR